jgi:LPXTG-site transpeptidase (sortase) family protein
MAGLSRRRLIVLCAAALVGAAACGSPEASGLRGTGTVLRPRDPADATPSRQPERPAGEDGPAGSEATKMPTPEIVPTRAAVPTSEPIVPPDAVPLPPVASTDAEMHVVPVPTGKAAMAASLPAKRLIIPTIGLDSRVIQLGTKLDRRGHIAWETAPFAVGQHRGLAGPGQNGNMVLSGHISSPNEGSVFHNLPDVKMGEGVIVSTEERQYLYRVTNIATVTPDEVSVLDQTPDPTATLITCVPDGIYSHRLVVTTRLV